MTRSLYLSEGLARILAGALIVVAVLVSYLPVFHAGFIIDDANSVTENPELQSLKGLGQIWCRITTSPHQYYPVTYSSFWLEYRLWGPDPAGYHISNVLLHGINAFLVWILLQSLGVRGAWIAAALFALHPVQVESVAW